MPFFPRFSSKTSQRSSGSSNESTPGTTPEGSGSESTLTKTLSSSSKLARILSNTRSKRTSSKSELAHLHKPFTPENLEHQKILNAFEWNFGTKRNSFDSSFSGISPCTSRRCSLSESDR